MLGTYPNLWIDVAWVVYENDLLTDGKPNADWVALVEKYPTRFMIGSDKVGHFSDYPSEMTKYWLFLDALKPDTAKNIGHDNLLSVLPKSGATLTEEEAASINGNRPAGMELLKQSPGK